MRDGSVEPPRERSRSSLLLLIPALLLLSVANGRWPLAPAAWLAPVILLVFIEARPWRSGLAWAGLAQLLAFCVNWRGMIPVPGFWYYLVAGIYALAYFLPFVLHRLIAGRLDGFGSTLVFPVSWVAIEFLFQQFATPYGSWASLAYTQVGFLPILQLASVTGVAGIHFVMTWFAAVAAWAWRQERRSASLKAGVATCGAVMGAVLIWGQWRIVSAPTDPPLLRVATVTPAARLERELQMVLRSLSGSPSIEGSSLEAVSEIARRMNDDLLARSEQQALAGAEVIVWSEHAARVTRQGEAELIERGRRLARSAGVHLILGIGLWDPDARPAFENKAVMIDAEGTVSGTYHKARPIVGQEAAMIAKGDSRIATLETAHGRFGVVICHDLDFPDLLREAGRLGVDVLFGPSSDWEAITLLHAQMAIPRAVENGFTLVRPTSNGLSLVVDPLGRIVASQADLGESGNTLVASVPLDHLPTAYPFLGDTFVYVDLLVLLLLLGRAATTALRGRSAGGAPV